jgi:hypothetical protein
VRAPVASRQPLAQGGDLRIDRQGSIAGNAAPAVKRSSESAGRQRALLRLIAFEPSQMPECGRQFVSTTVWRPMPDLHGPRARIRCVRSFAMCALGLAAATALLAVATGPAGATSCERPLQAAPAQLPAAIVVATDCGRYRFDRRGRVDFRRGFALPVPPGANYYMDLTWYRIRGGRLTIGHRLRTLWRSEARFRQRYVGMGAVASSRRAVAFSTFHGRRQSLFVARPGQAARFVASDETPLGFSGSGALVSQRRSTLLLRDGRDWRARRLISGASDVVFDHGAHAVYFLARGRLERFDGARITQLATLASLRVGRRPQIEPLRRLVSVRSARRLAVLRGDGSVFASTPLPRPLARADLVSSALAADDRSSAVAFTATRGNTAYGPRGRELVYLLRPGATAARVLFRERLTFAGCERGASLSWRAAGCSTPRPRAESR